MAGTCTASVLHGPHDLRLVQRRIAEPGNGEVQVKIKATGICGSDIHYYKDFRNGDIHIQEPLSLGHESVGTVYELGPHVNELKIGDRVALEVGVPCGSCDRCKNGRYNICRTIRFRSSGKGVPHYQGTLQQQINHPAKFCHK